MSHLVLQEVEKKFINSKVPALKPGYTIRVHQKIKEGEKERVQVFEGLVIALSHGRGTNKMVTVRKEVEGIGVEKIFPIHSPNIAKIEVTKTSKIRRAKLYYMRELTGKSTRLRAKYMTDEKADAAEKTEKHEKKAPKAEAEAPAETAEAAPEQKTEETK